MNDLIPVVKIDGQIVIDNKNIYDKDVDEVSVRKKNWNGFSTTKSISKINLWQCCLCTTKTWNCKKGKDCDELVETSLRKSGLWDEVKDKLTNLELHFQVVNNKDFVLQEQLLLNQKLF